MSKPVSFDHYGQQQPLTAHTDLERQLASPSDSGHALLGPETALLPDQVDLPILLSLGYQRTSSSYSAISSNKFRVRQLNWPSESSHSSVSSRGVDGVEDGTMKGLQDEAKPTIFKCPLCREAFTRRNTLLRHHYHRHTKPKPHHIPGPYTPSIEYVELPTSFNARDPARAQINRQEDLSLKLKDEACVNSRSNHDSMHISNPRIGSAMPGCNTLSPVLKRPSKVLDDYTAREFAVRFARFAQCLASRSGAHAWGESVVARLDCSSLAFELKPLLLPIYYDLGDLVPHVCLQQSVAEIMEDICLYFYEEMKSNSSRPETVPIDVGATETIAGQEMVSSSTELTRGSGLVGQGHDLRHLRSVSNVIDKLTLDKRFNSLCKLVREKLYSEPRSSMDLVQKFLSARYGRSDPLDGLYPPNRFFWESREFVIETHLTLVDYIKQNFSEQQVKLSTLVTITGTIFYAYATTCLDYLKRTWPRSGEILLALLQEAIWEVLGQPGSKAGTNPIIRKGMHLKMYPGLWRYSP
jgi:hypothetical protein